MAKRKLSAGRKIILAVCLIVFTVSATLVVKHYWDLYQYEKNLSSISNLVEAVEEDDSAPDYSEVIKVNPDFVGWIKVPNTNIDYPVVKTIDNSYYLRHNFNKEYHTLGTVFMDYRNDPLNLDANTILYAHNAYDNRTMFSELSQYEDIEFFKKTPVFEFNTAEKSHKWKIYAVFVTTTKENEDNGYVFNYIYPYMGGKNFDGYKAELDKRTLYTTGIDLQKDDRVLTLSTCTRGLDLYKYGRRTYKADARLVIVARAVRKGESPEVDVSEAYINPSPKYPQLWYDKNGIKNPYKNEEKWYPKEVIKR